MVTRVHIPVQNSAEEVEVALDQLPRDSSDILDILKAEQAPLDIWLIIAVSSEAHCHVCMILSYRGGRFAVYWDVFP